MISTFPLRNYHAAKDATVDLLMTLVQKCSGWLKFQNECGIVVRNAIGNLLQPHHGKSTLKIEKVENVVIVYYYSCNYRYSDYFDLIPLLLSSLQSYLSNKPKHCH